MCTQVCELRSCAVCGFRQGGSSALVPPRRGSPGRDALLCAWVRIRWCVSARVCLWLLVCPCALLPPLPRSLPLSGRVGPSETGQTDSSSFDVFPQNCFSCYSIFAFPCKFWGRSSTYRSPGWSRECRAVISGRRKTSAPRVCRLWTGALSV